jgi:amino acid transporter
VKHRLGCVLFTVVGLAWLGFVSFELFATTLGDCVEGTPCEFYRGYVEGFVFWRGLAVALLLILAYLGFRAFTKDDDVQ